MASTQQDSHAYVTTAAITFPLTITAASNDQIEYNEQEFLIPAGVYATPAALVKALNACTNDEDNSGAKLNTFIHWEVEPAAQTTKVRATSLVKGADTLAFGTGAEHDGLASIGITDTWPINHTASGLDNGTKSAQNTVYSAGVYWDGTEYASNEHVLS